MSACQEQGFRRIEESIARKPAVRRALSSLEENTLIRTQQIWLREAERNVSPTTTSTFLSALTDEAISPITVVRPPPLVLSSSLTETQRKALPEGWPPELKFSARIEAAWSPSAPAEPDDHAHPTQVAHGERRLVQQGEGEAQDASGAGGSPERPRASSHAAAEPSAVTPHSPSRRGWPRPLLKASPAAAAVPVASPRRGSSPVVSSPRGVRSPGTALLADLLDEAARQASSLTRSFNAPDKALHGKVPAVKAPAVSSGGAGSYEGRGSSDDSIRGGAGGGGGVSARLSDEAHRAARCAEQSRLELALAHLSRHEAQGLRGEMQLEMQLEMHEQGAQLTELQLCVLRLHEEQRALIAAHREWQQREFSEVQACACIIS